MALTERLQILIDAHGGGAIAEFKKVGVAAKGLDASAVGGTKAMGGLGQAGLNAGGLLKSGMAAGAVAAGAAIVGFGVSSVNAFNDLAQEVLKFQRASGATAEESSALIAAFDDMGIEAETGSKAIFQLGKRLETSAKTLSGYGVVAVKNAAGNTDLAATLKSVADAYVKTTDPAKRAALVTAAFGKSGQDLIPLLEKGSAGIEAFYAGAASTGQILSKDDIAKAEKFRVAMDDLEDAFREFQLAAGEALVPTITGFAELITKVVDLSSKLLSVGPGIHKALGLDEKEPSQNTGYLLDDLKNKLFGVKAEAEETGPFIGSLGGAFVALAAQAKPVVEASEEADKALNDLGKALFATADADRALVDAHRDVASAQSALNKLLKDGAVDEEKVADARRSLAEATRSAADADRGLAKAQKEYDESVAASSALGGLDSAMDEVADKAEGLADAQDSAASAHERAKEAAKDLKDAQAGDPEFQQKLADARQKVADATFNMSQKSLASVNAHKEEATALSLHSDQVQRLYDLNAGLITQHPDLLVALTPSQAALGDALPSFGGGGDFPIGGPTVNGAGQPVQTTTATTNNVTINAMTSEADARQIAKEVMWNLN